MARRSTCRCAGRGPHVGVRRGGRRSRRETVRRAQGWDGPVRGDRGAGVCELRRGALRRLLRPDARTSDDGVAGAGAGRLDVRMGVSLCRGPAWRAYRSVLRERADPCGSWPRATCGRPPVPLLGSADRRLAVPAPPRTASVDARGYMPLLFLDDDEHWPLSNPDWFLHTAGVSHCPSPTVYDGCRPVSPATMADPSLGFLQFDPEAYREGAPPVMFVNQTEPFQRPAPDAEPIISAYRFFDYWWYYSFNRGPYGNVTRRVGLEFDHLSDWEGVTVASLPGRQDRFDFVAMSAHTASWNYLPGVLRCGEGLVEDARHETSCVGRKRVNTYAADGTHANYPRRCGKSLTQISDPGPGLCLQTGSPVPEGRFNGEDDGPSLMPTTSLATLASLAPRDWPRYAGSWASGDIIESPTFQDRFRNPVSGNRECTRRWDGAAGAVPCEPEFQRPPPGSSWRTCCPVSWRGRSVRGLVRPDGNCVGVSAGGAAAGLGGRHAGRGRGASRDRDGGPVRQRSGRVPDRRRGRLAGTGPERVRERRSGRRAHACGNWTAQHRCALR